MGRKPSASPMVKLVVYVTNHERQILEVLALDKDEGIAQYVSHLCRDACAGYKLVARVEKVPTLFPEETPK